MTKIKTGVTFTKQILEELDYLVSIAGLSDRNRSNYLAQIIHAEYIKQVKLMSSLKPRNEMREIKCEVYKKI